MSILSRFADILSANINSLLDKAEDPSKMINQYLIDARKDLAEVKEETASVMADEVKAKRVLDANRAEIEKYTSLAKKALEAGNEGDARTFIAKKQSLGLMAVAFAFVCFWLMFILLFRMKKCIFEIGAKGAITVALFAAISFGGIALPSTVLGDLVHALLGPFSGLVTGLLSGIMQYLLIVSLLVLYRKPGVLTLLYVLKFMLSGIMFGHFSPIGVLSTSVYIVVTESLLWISGFYTKEILKTNYMFFVALLLGMGDALITFVNLEQMMFFYRLYYADWFLAMYMIVNGLLYSSIGSWIGYKTGIKLRQVVGE